MASYAIKYQGFGLVGAASTLKILDVPIQRKNQIEALKLMAKAFHKESSVGASIAYLKRRTKKAWVEAKAGTKKYIAFVFLTNEDTFRHENEQVFINDIPHSDYISDKFNVVPIYLD